MDTTSTAPANKNDLFAKSICNGINTVIEAQLKPLINGITLQTTHVMAQNNQIAQLQLELTSAQNDINRLISMVELFTNTNAVKKRTAAASKVVEGNDETAENADNPTTTVEPAKLPIPKAAFFKLQYKNNPAFKAKIIELGNYTEAINKAPILQNKTGETRNRSEGVFVWQKVFSEKGTALAFVDAEFAKSKAVKNTQAQIDSD